ncbi:MAG: SpoIIE family protein phosphatase [Opitutales bacterium]|jgi:phosphoserine phosphatase RsbU/P|nr:SpoIIE family protein phosphatase [Opitutales bacterium]MDP4645310.1 SpoIIE family protein phosphatase [Opitutales bacterium]MDP4693875.1 SpoIIE family protein phosphatase [Opitutales bacterium]MDP4776441.1 SpoIIE family protein phosphatase [Opitutales bacterium]MDP4878341.1 SpoIIE family protein phosphatase [Opitutales bacterium]
MMPFTIGVLAGLFGMWLLYAKKRRQLKILDEEKQLLQQEKQIVVEFMHNMVEAVAQSPERETMFQRIIHAAILSTGAVSACIFEKRDDDTLQGIAVEGLFPPQRKLSEDPAEAAQSRAHYLEKILKSESFKMGEGLIGQVAKSRQALLIPDAANDPRVVQHNDPSLLIRSIIVAPVLFKGELMAVLAVANPADGLAFTDTDFSLVESLAEQVGLAVHNSEAMLLQIEKNKIDLDIELASNTQRLLLPKAFPPSDSISFATHYTAAQKVGGDLYDIFSLDDQTIAFAIADVSGKGVSASILMAICQTHLRHYANQYRSPSEVLGAINAAMQPTMQRDMFITMVYATIDLKTETLTLARAGHELPFFYDQHTDGSLDVAPIQSPGMPVGMVPPDVFDSVIKDTHFHFDNEDALLLYTDGVTEMVNPEGEEYSGERLLRILTSHGKESAQVILDQTLDSIHRFAAGAGQPDDLTMIVIKHS